MNDERIAESELDSAGAPVGASPGFFGDRRCFLKAASLPCFAACAGAFAGVPLAARAFAGAPADPDAQFIREAQFYEKQPYKKIKCKLCPRECVIDDRERGYCGARENRGGTYYTLVHSRVVTAHIDPVEKKPFFHFLPGAMAFSLATAGCNVNCKMCQNWEISQVRPEQVRSTYAPPANIAALARQNRCATIAYTYSEPVIFYEYMVDVADAGHQEGSAASLPYTVTMISFGFGGILMGRLSDRFGVSSPGFTLSRHSKGQIPGVRPLGRHKARASLRSSSVQAFSEAPSAYYAVC